MGVAAPNLEQSDVALAERLKLVADEVRYDHAFCRPFDEDGGIREEQVGEFCARR